ncbi:MAG: efflux RND transporter periplasmic adaptor subunit [Xanthobacteraceae bacterium]|nr:efflux RND transporter periplasmic adaptor subunit [Xanthobacteraceae bacterium]
MNRRTLVVGVAGVLALAGGGIFLWTGSSGQKAAAQGPRAERSIPVAVAKAVRKPVPFRLEALGTVTTIASVAVKPRIDSEIVAVKFEDGARVKQGDVLFVLDSRTIEAEIKRVEAVITSAEAQHEQAVRDVARYSELVQKNATTQVTLNNSMTQLNVSKALAESNKAMLQGLKVQLGYTTIRAPISGRTSMASAKVGNIVRQADIAPLATINQVAPIYVSFTVPQRSLPDVRAALAAETATLEAIVPGSGARATGQVTMIENAVDAATGMVTVRATMPNEDELLWPGTLVNTALTLRNDVHVSVPTAALQISQEGQFVFVVKDNAAIKRLVKVERAVDGVAAIAAGLEEGETVVTDGQLQLQNGTRVSIRGARAES